MNRRTFIILLTTIFVMSLLLLLNRDNFERVETSVVLPGLDTALNDITKLTIKTAGNRTVTTLMRGTERWTVVERGHYPADVGKIRQNLIALANAMVIEEKTADPALYARLGVEDIASADATGIELIIDSLNSSYRIIVGMTGIRGSQAYARLPDTDTSLLIAANLELDSEPADWLDHTLIDIPASDIVRVTTTHPDGETVAIEKNAPDAGNFELVNQPVDSELTTPGAANSIGSLLTGLTFDDVLTRENAGLQDQQPVVTRFVTLAGLVIIANIHPGTEQNFVSFEFTTVAEDEASPASASAKADELNARYGNWLFILPSYKLEQLTRRQADLLK
ncbi:MAG: DUF4340 domain-containing protein [Gammaproteobacteria bacterium]|nr:hypothetical protein [Chromatiales bacterium]MCP4925784.1 DUF4340 domain-containing protein [Gammaproteobacteria bacterium]MDP7659843.1 DUF4340 domain-containing protein [Gammaproteobacteria bacterium]